MLADAWIRPEYPTFRNSVEGDWFQGVAHFYVLNGLVRPVPGVGAPASFHPFANR
jgi:hypothetical protein